MSNPVPLFPAGSLFINSDDFTNYGASSLTAVALSPTTGATIGTLANFIAGEGVACTGQGVLAFMSAPNETGGDAGVTSAINLYDLGFNLITSITGLANLASPGWTLFARIASDWAHTFYVAGFATGIFYTKVYSISDAGVVGGTTWTVTTTSGIRPSPMAPSRDGTILYYGEANSGGWGVSNVPLHRWDLVNDVAMTDLVPALGAGNGFGLDLFVLPDTSILVTTGFGLGGHNLQVRRYSATGTLLNTYPLDTNAGKISLPELALDPSDATVFWVRSFPTLAKSTYTKYKIADGSTVTSFIQPTRDVVDGGSGLIPISCPLLVLSLAPAPPPPPVVPPPCAQPSNPLLGCAGDLPGTADSGGGIGCAGDVASPGV